MLHLSSASRVEPLATALAGILSEPLEDPMTPEWVAVPSAAMRRWLALELARSLGASSPFGGDGVAANIEFPFPGTLRQVVLQGGRVARASDPWHVDSLVWAVLDVLAANGSDERLDPVRQLAPGATTFGRARRIADLFDRYSARRPGLIANWVRDLDLDPTGRPLPEYDHWQPHLWRLVRAHIGAPSPPERLPKLLEALRSGALDTDLPQRLAIFGVSTLPGGPSFVEILLAVAARRDVHLMMLDPSPATTARVRELDLGRGLPIEILRSEETDDELAEVRHPLLASWGRAYRERTELLTAFESAGAVRAPLLVEADSPRRPPTTLLARMQEDIHAGKPPAADFVPTDDDRSFQVHSCHGETRQVQVLRDAILHLLSSDPSLFESDIAVVCPALDQFAPLVEAGFGPSADADSPQGTALPDTSAPRLYYRVTDRSLRESVPLLGALDVLLALLAGRFEATRVLDFISLPPVRRRFALDDDAVEVIANWVSDANVRWGLDAAHRRALGLPLDFEAYSWRNAVDRVLYGIAVSDNTLGLAPGETAPLNVESGHIEVAGRFADLVDRLERAANETALTRTVTDWRQMLLGLVEQFFGLELGDAWQLDRFREIVGEISERAGAFVSLPSTGISLADVRRLLAEKLEGIPQRTDFYRGGITLSSLTPLRWLPFRVVCVLGLDEFATESRADGDDLAARDPLVGDRDQKGETRQALLEALLAAGEYLVITRSGHSVRTNRAIPMATVLAELRDTVCATLTPECRDAAWRRIETIHPRQSFDARSFTPGELGVPGPWSFDTAALEGALSLRKRPSDRRPFLAQPLARRDKGEVVVSLEDLRRFLRHPAESFLTERLQVRLVKDEAAHSDELGVPLSALEDWAIADRLIAARLEGHSTAEWVRHERALGVLPPGGLGEREITKIVEAIDALLAAADERGVALITNERLHVDLLVGGARLVGEVALRCQTGTPGAALVTSSRLASKHRLAAWLDLLALVASEPSRNWRSVVIGRGNKDAFVGETFQMARRVTTADERRQLALASLEVALDCRSRGLVEPIPLFASFSELLHEDRAKPDKWRPEKGHGEGNEEANRLAFGDLDYSGVLALRPLAWDPPGQAVGRARRFADYLYGAMDDSTEVVHS